MRVEIAERGGNVEVRTIPPTGPRGAGEAAVDYMVTLPANINIVSALNVGQHARAERVWR